MVPLVTAPSSDPTTTRGLLRTHRDLRLLLAAGLVTMTGDWMLSVGLVYTVYDVTGSTLASAVALMAAFVPQVVTGLVAGVFVDRWSRARTMVVGNVLMAVGITPCCSCTARTTSGSSTPCWPPTRCSTCSWPPPTRRCCR